MDDSRFDDLVRRLSESGARRPLLGAGLTALAALGTSLAWSGEADAKKKKKKKKKKGKKGKKGGTTTQQPTTQPPVTCPTGQKTCNGGCIPDEKCCTSAECAPGQQCTQGVCFCTASNKIKCGEQCCDKATEICKNDLGIATCLGGTCPATTFCESGVPDHPQYYCANSASGFCVCTSTVDPAPQRACVDIEAVQSCGTACANSGQCPSGSVCIEAGANCGCPGNFCAPICTL